MRTSADAPRAGAAARVRVWSTGLPWWAPLALVTAIFVVVGWATLMQVGPRGGYDSPALQAYAELYDREGRLPTEAENYEYWLPPGLPVAAVYLKRLTEALPLPPEPLSFVPSPVRRLAWLALVVAALALLASPGRRVLGAAAGAVALVWGGAHALWSVKSITWDVYPEVAWLGYPLLSLAACTGLVFATGLVAREAWPSSRFAPALAATAVALFPIVPRIGLFFHPDPWLAFFSALAMWLVLLGARTGWLPWTGFLAGAVMGVAALVRPSAALVMGCLGLGALLVGRRRTMPFLAVAALAVVAIAGPWWVIQTSRTGNPLKSNLERPGYMLDRQPLSFYVSLPVHDVLFHPYRPRIENELLPRFHAELWADWGLNLLDQEGPTTLQRVTASTQSILGLGGDALVLGGLALLGIPALRRVRRRGPPGSEDAALAVSTILFALTWVVYVATLIRFPQAEGDPIKSNYVLFVAPACAIAGLAAARRLWARGGWTRWALGLWIGAYAVSYALVFVGAG